MTRPPSLIALLLTTLLFALLPSTNASQKKYVQATDSDGQTVLVPDTRRPSLYTQDFGTCGGKSLIDVSRFDAAWYKDNMTVLFHLEGSTKVANDSLMSLSTNLSSKELGLILEQCSSVSSPTVKHDLISPLIPATHRSTGELGARRHLPSMLTYTVYVPSIAAYLSKPTASFPYLRMMSPIFRRSQRQSRTLKVKLFYAYSVTLQRPRSDVTRLLSPMVLLSLNRPRLGQSSDCSP